MNSNDFEDFMPYVDYHVHRICTPSWSIGKTVTNIIDLTYVIRGSALYCVNEQKIRVTSGDLLCIPKGNERAAVSVPDDLMECYAVNFTLFNHHAQEVSLPFPLHCHIGHHPDLIEMYKNLNAEWLQRIPGYQIKVKAIMLLILHRCLEIFVYKNGTECLDFRIKKALHYIANNYSDSISMTDLVQLTGLTSAYLGKLFKQSTGMTFRQYLMFIRLNHATDLLHAGECNVSEAASLCGFSDVYYFSKMFKERWGFPPSKIIKAR